MTTDVRPVRWTGVGSWPGEDMAEALTITFDECPDLPYLPELPARGAPSSMVGRGTALLSGLAVDLQPAGWRLTDASGSDHRRAITRLREDLDLLEEHAQGYAGLFKLSVAGPWTLAAMVERPRGDRALADSGARRDLGQSETQGLADLVVELQRRLPQLSLIVQLDEPLLPAVLAGAVPTASGFSRHRSVEAPEASGVVAAIVDRLGSLTPSVPVVVHGCAAGMPIGLLHRAGVRGLSLDLDQLRGPDWDAVAAAMEDGVWLGAGVVPAADAPGPDHLAARVLGPLRDLGLQPEVSSRLVLTPACGLAGVSVAEAVRTLRLRTAAGIVTDELAR